jgi:hypothetical protein
MLQVKTYLQEKQNGFQLWRIHPAEVIDSLQNGIIISLPLRNVFELLVELSHRQRYLSALSFWILFKQIFVIFSFFFYRCRSLEYCSYLPIHV